jgi:uncharacterized flavoprotein (TIGR03862 family)
MKKQVAIIGSGPAALMASVLDQAKFEVILYEKNFAPARKFLVAGDGGFNLTHSEEMNLFVARYTPQEFLAPCLRAFTNEDLRAWLKSLGIETLVGSSKRVFPVKGIKPIDVLNAILNDLRRKNVTLKTSHEWKGWTEKNELRFTSKTGELTVKPDLTVFALGGASWSKTGSDGSWSRLFAEKGIDTLPFQSSNCAYRINWDKAFLSQWEGKSLKNISLACGGAQKKGEVVITAFGMEGGAVYALSPQIRKELAHGGEARLFLDLKPSLSQEEIQKRLQQKKSGSLTDLIKSELSLSPLHVALLKSLSTREDFTDKERLAEKIKNLPVTILAAAPIDDAISTVGGLALHEVDDSFQLKKLAGAYAIGEMLDWDAPTGGYLLQACFSMGAWAGRKINALS